MPEVFTTLELALASVEGTEVVGKKFCNRFTRNGRLLKTKLVEKERIGIYRDERCSRNSNLYRKRQTKKIAERR